MISCAERFTALMDDAGLTAKEAASLLGYSVHAIYSKRSGRRPIRACDLLGLRQYIQEKGPKR